MATRMQYHHYLRSYHWSVVGWHVDTEIPAKPCVPDWLAEASLAFTAGMLLGIVHFVFGFGF